MLEYPRDNIKLILTTTLKTRADRGTRVNRPVSRLLPINLTLGQISGGQIFQLSVGWERFCLRLICIIFCDKIAFSQYSIFVVRSSTNMCSFCVLLCYIALRYSPFEKKNSSIFFENL